MDPRNHTPLQKVVSKTHHRGVLVESLKGGDAEQQHQPLSSRFLRCKLRSQRGTEIHQCCNSGGKSALQVVLGGFS